MNTIIIREPVPEDTSKFIAAMQHSQVLHHPWVKAPLTVQEFDEYLLRLNK